MKINKYTIIRFLLILALGFMFLTCKQQDKNTEKMYSIVPYPNILEIKQGNFELNKDTKFIILNNTEKLKNRSELFRILTKQKLGFDLKVGTNANLKKNYISIKIDSSLTSLESYNLSITKKFIQIIGGSEKGVFYGLQTLRQLIKIDTIKNNNEATFIEIPNTQINDTPRYAWRGIMVDESRHFFGKEKIKQVIELMSLQKLNKFHWHLTDAPGWRIEIKKYPKLTSIGSKGDYSNPNVEPQFYTQQDLKEIIQFAAQRNIDVIPEIDMPGHASAAIRAYPELSGGGTKKHPHFTFHPARESTYSFLTNILREVADLFPSKYIHIGADEVSFGNKHWIEDREVKALMRSEKLKTIKDVETYFVNRIRDTIVSLQKELIGWDEVIENGMNNNKTTAMWWRHDKPEILEKGLTDNYKVILCPRKPLYFDFVQHSSHKLGRRWDGFGNLNDVYSFPDSLSNIDVSKPEVLGIQANLWTEQINTEKRFDFMLYTRMSALSEAAWTDKKNKSFESFKIRLKDIFNIYKSKNINYFDYFSPENIKEPGNVLKPNWIKNFSSHKN